VLREQRPGWSAWIVLVVLLLGFAAYQYYSGRQEGTYPPISYTAFWRAAQEEKVESVTIRSQSVIGKLRQEQSIEGKQLKNFSTMIPAQGDDELMPLLRSKNVEITVRSEEQPLAVSLLMNLIPIALIIRI